MPARGDPGALEPLRSEQCTQGVRGRVERRRIGGQADEDQAADLAHRHTAQSVVAPIQIAIRVHPAARRELAAARVRPLVIWTHDARDVTGLLMTDLHPPVTARIVERVDRRVVAADDDDRVGIDLEDEVVAGLLHLTGVTGEEPAASPDALEIELVDAGIGLELSLQRVARLVLDDQAIQKRTSIREL